MGGLLMVLSCAAAPHITGAGASFPAALYKEASFAYSHYSSVEVSYTLLGSGRGKCRIKGWEAHCSDDEQPHLIDFAASDSVLSDDEYEAFPDLQMYPTVASAVVPVYHLPNVSAAEPALVLTKQVLGDIFRGNITMWDDPRIGGLNPSLTASGKLPSSLIRVVVRSDSSGTTELFKKALARSDPEGFGAQIGTSSSSTWNGATVHRCASASLGTAPCLLATPFSIGYTNLAEVLDVSLQAASILQSESAEPVVASADSVFAGLAQTASNFVRNDDGSSRLVIDTDSVLSLAAWPIVGVTYLVMRKDTSLFTDEDRCERRRHTLHFWRWFYTAPQVRKMATRLGFSMLPDSKTSHIISRLETDIRCDGKPVYVAVGPSIVIRGGGSHWHTPDFNWQTVLYKDAQLAYEELQDDEAIRSLAAGELDLAAVHYDRWASSQNFVNGSMVAVPYAGFAVGVAYSFCGLENATNACLFHGRNLTLDIDLISQILSGNLSLWLDPRLVALNTWMGEEPYASAIGLAQPIVLIGEPPGSASQVAVARWLQRHNHSQTMEVLEHGDRTVHASAHEHALALLAATSFSMGLVALSGGEDFELTFASIIPPRGSGDGVRPSVESLAACLPTSVRSEDDAFRLEESTAKGCYPLSVTTVMLLRQSLEGDDCTLGGATVDFVKWLSEEERDRPESIRSVLPLSVLVRRLTNTRLYSVMCDGTSWLESHVDQGHLPVVLVAIAWCCGLTMAGVLLVWIVWAYRHWHGYLKASQPWFLVLIIVGIGFSTSGGILATRDHANYVADDSVDIGARGRYRDLDTSCAMQLWYFFIGNSLIFGSLVAKLWRVTVLLVNPAMRDVKVPILHYLRYVGVFVLLNAAILVGWTLGAPPYYRLEIYQAVGIEGKERWHGACEMLPDGALPYALTLLTLHLLLIYFGIYLCNRARKVQTKYSDGKSIAFILWQYTQMTLLGILVGALVYPFSTSGSPTAYFLVRWLEPLIVNATIVALLFVGRMIDWWRDGRHQRPAPIRQSGERPPSTTKSSHRSFRVLPWAATAAEDHRSTTSSRVQCGSTTASVRQSSRPDSNCSNGGRRGPSGARSSPEDLLYQLDALRQAYTHVCDELEDARTDLTDLRERNYILQQTFARRNRDMGSERASEPRPIQAEAEGDNGPDGVREL